MWQRVHPRRSPRPTEGKQRGERHKGGEGDLAAVPLRRERLGTRRRLQPQIEGRHERTLKQLKEALQAHHQALEQLESALVEFEQSITEEATLRLQQEEHRGVQLLSIPQVCEELGMGKSWVYRRLRSGQVPSIRLGHTIKVRRDELEQCLESHHYPAREQETSGRSWASSLGALWMRRFSE